MMKTLKQIFIIMMLLFAYGSIGAQEYKYVRVTDLSQIEDGSTIVIAARFNENANQYYALPTDNITNSIAGVEFSSTTTSGEEILPSEITDSISKYSLVVSIDGNSYSFTNSIGQKFGYKNGNSFGADVNPDWTVTRETSADGTLVPNYEGFHIINTSTGNRAISVSKWTNAFAAHFTNYLTSGNYNFAVDIFMLVEPEPTANYVRITDLSEITDGSSIVIASRYNENANEYYAMSSIIQNSIPGVPFTSAIASNDEILPSEITDSISKYILTVSIDGNNYSFTNAAGQKFGYKNGNSFGADVNPDWTVTRETSADGTLVPNYEGFHIINTSTGNRAISVSKWTNAFAAHFTNYLTSGNYNFAVDIFMLKGGAQEENEPKEAYIRVTDLSQIKDGNSLVITTRYNENQDQYKAMLANKINSQGMAEPFSSISSLGYEMLPTEITDSISKWAWTVSIEEGNYTFTNVNGDQLGCNYGFKANVNPNWVLSRGTSEETAMVPYYEGFNAKNTVQERWMDYGSSGRFILSMSQYMNHANHNFFLDFFVLKKLSSTTSAPVLELSEGSYMTSATVSISCKTAGATIYYTTDGSDPTEASSVYTEPFVITSTSTVKAVAVLEGLENSPVAKATYTIIPITTISEARNADVNTITAVEGIVTYINGNNIFVQDSTAAINLCLNGNTVPSNLSVGDKVQAYGTRNTNNGLVELKNIIGTSSSQFIVVSSNNDLPLTQVTIEQILNDFDNNNMLQSTRVSIIGAKIGDINVGGTTSITQNGKTINILSTPNVVGIKKNDYVTLTGLVGCNNTPNMLVVSSEDIRHSSNIKTDYTSMGLFYNEKALPVSQALNIEALYLVENLNLSVSPNFQVSGTIDGTYTDNMILEAVDGTIQTDIYVRLLPDLEKGQYTGTLTLSNNEITYEVELTGSVATINMSYRPIGARMHGEKIEISNSNSETNYVRVTDLSEITDGSSIVIAARYNENANDYLALATDNITNNIAGVAFASTTASNGEILPATITDSISKYVLTVSIDGDNYSFTNANGQQFGYRNGSSFGADINPYWTVTKNTSGEGTLVPNYEGFNIINTSTGNRAISLSKWTWGFAAHFTNYITSANYNFSVDIFMLVESEPNTEAITLSYIDCSAEGFIIKDEDKNDITFPVTIEPNETLDFYVTTDAEASVVYEGLHTATLGLFWENTNEVTLHVVSAYAYTPIANDVVETAETITEFPFNKTQSTEGLYGNYILPGANAKGVDAVYKMVVDNETLINVNLTACENPQVAVYKESVINGNYPSEDNYQRPSSYIINDGNVIAYGGDMIRSLVLEPGTYYMVASTTSSQFDIEAWTAPVPVPIQATLIAPAYGEKNVTTPVTLSWMFGQYTTEYQLLFGTTIPPTEVLVDWTSDLNNTYVVDSLYYNANYSWQINERNVTGTTIGDVWSFTTTLETPKNLTVENTELYPGQDAVLTWDAPVNRYTRGYNIYQDGVKINAELVTETSYTVSNLSYNKDGYNFNITTMHDAGESAFSDTVKAYMTGYGNIEGYTYEQDGTTPLSDVMIVFEGIDEYGNEVEKVFISNNNGYYSGEILVGTYNGTTFRDNYQNSELTDIVINYNSTTSNVNFIIDELFVPVYQVMAEEANDFSNVNVYWSWDKIIPESPYADFETGDFSQARFNNEITLNHPWVMSDNAYEGSYAMRSSCEGATNGISSIEVSVFVPYDGVVSFYHKVSSEEGADFGRFFIDGIEVSSISGETEWTEAIIPVTEGNHTYVWTYSKNESGDNGNDAYYVDNIMMYKPTPAFEGWIYYDNGEFVSGVGTNNIAPVYWGIKFPNTMDYEGSTLTKVAFYDEYAADYTANIYIGAMPSQATLVATQPFTTTGVGDLVEIDLSTPVPVNPELPLWITMYCNQLTHPASACEHTGDSNSDWISLNGTTWNHVTDYNLDYSWILRGYLEDLDGKIRMISNNDEPITFEGGSSDGEIVALETEDPKFVGVPSNDMTNISRSFSTYKLYRYNNLSGEYTAETVEVLASEMTDTTFVDTEWSSLETGVYKYGIATVYEGNRTDRQSRGAKAYANVIYPVGMPNAYVSFDIDKPTTATEISPVVFDRGGDYYDGILYGYSSDNKFYHIEAETGEVIMQNNVSISMSEAAYNYANNTFYGISGSLLYTIDMETGDANLIGDLGKSIVAFGINYVGDAYGISIGSPSYLYSIDLNTASCTVIGNTGLNSNFVQCGGFNHYNNKFYWFQCSAVDDMNLYTIDIYSGAPTLVAANTGEVTSFFIPFTVPSADDQDLGIIYPFQGDNESTIVWSNTIDKNMTTSVEVNVETNSGDTAEGTVVRFVNVGEDSANNYEVVLDENGSYTWNNFRKGTYEVTISNPRFTSDVENVTMEIFEPIVINAMLTELIELSGLYVSPTGWAMWNEVGGSKDNRALVGYTVMLDDNVVAEDLMVPYYQHEDIVVGQTYTTTVVSHFTTGSSDPVSYTWTADDCSYYDGPSEFTAEYVEGKAIINWTEPGAEDSEVWMDYDGGTSVTGIGGAAQFFWAIKLRSEDIRPIAPTELTKVSMFDRIETSGTFYIYLGGDNAPEQLVHTQEYVCTKAYDYVEYELTSYIPIDGTQNVWVVFSTADGTNYPASAGNSCGDPDSRWFSGNGVDWTDIASMGLDYSWSIHACFNDMNVKQLPLGAFIFRDGELLTKEPLKTGTYTEEVLSGSEYEYCLRLVYDGYNDVDTCLMSCPQCVTIDAAIVCDAPENLYATTGVNENGEEGISLVWPYYEPVNEWLYYDDGSAVSAMGAGGNIYWAVMFPANSLESYEGTNITKLMVFDYEAGAATASVYLGGDMAPGTLVHSQEFEFTGSQQWLELDVADMITIDATENVWITMHQVGATYPAAVCNTTGDPNGRWVSVNGTEWVDLATLGNFPYTWMLRAFVTNQNGKDSRALDHYNVYRSETNDNYELIAETTEGNYFDVINEDGTYYYKVTAFYTENGEECESDPANAFEDDSQDYVFVDFVSIDELDSNNITVYPNPTNDKLNVYAENMTRIVITNALGVVVYEKDIDTDNEIIDMSQYSSGVYMLHVTSENRIITKRITVIL